MLTPCWPDCLQEKKLSTVYIQLIKLIKCVQFVSEVVSFECAWKVEEQQAGCYNLVAWKLKKQEYTEVDSQLSWLAWRYKLGIN